jgi:septin family protein
MKSAYELAMERLSKSAPTVKLSDDQKQRLAELDSKCAAKIAEKELALKGDIEKAIFSGDEETAEKLQQQLVSDRQRLREELESKKDEIRRESAK